MANGYKVAYRNKKVMILLTEKEHQHLSEYARKHEESFSDLFREGISHIIKPEKE